MLLWLPLACVPGRGGWEASVLPLPLEEGAALDLGRLTDGLPDFLPEADGLSLFLCRWSTEEPIPVRLASGALASERRLWEIALRAWESAGLGISFSTEEAPAYSGIHMAFPTGSQTRPRGTGDALADCRVTGPGRDGGAVEAHLTWASIHLNRSLVSWKGARVPLGEDEMLGAMLHELGHALGFSGHARSGHSIMVADKTEVKQIARRVREGGSLPAPELVALYRLESGVRVGGVSLSSGEALQFQDLEAQALQAGMRGPYSRVGDRQAEFFYRGEHTERIGVRVENYLAVLGRKESPVLVPLR